MKFLSAFILLSVSSTCFAIGTERETVDVQVNENACVLLLDNRVFELEPLQAEKNSRYKHTVGFGYSFFKKRPSSQLVDNEFYTADHKDLLHTVHVYLSIGASEQGVTIESVQAMVGQEVYEYNKSLNFDPTFPSFVLDRTHVEKVYNQLVENKPLSYVFSYSNQIEMVHTPKAEQLYVNAKMFETCMEVAE